jgi:hypothetical protein
LEGLKKIQQVMRQTDGCNVQHDKQQRCNQL